MGTRTARRTALVVAASLILPAVALAASGTFTGTTSQGKVCGSNFHSACRVRVEIANHSVGKKGTSESHIFWRAACDSGNFLSDDTSFWGGLDQHNNLTVHGSYTQSGLGTHQGHPVTANNTVTIALHAGHSVTGTLKDSSVVHAGSKTIDHCHTGTVSFTARK